MAEMFDDDDDDKISELKVNLSVLPSSNGEFFIHLGDFIQSSRCRESSYQSFSTFLRENSPLPTFVLVGDNDWNDCSDPSEAITHWFQYFSDFDAHWSPHDFAVYRQMGYGGDGDDNNTSDNFSFLHKRTLFIGVRIVGGDEDDVSSDVWENLQTANVEWLRMQLGMNEGSFDALAVFGNNDGDEADNDRFFEALGPLLSVMGKKAIYFYKTGGSFRVQQRSIEDDDDDMTSAIRMASIPGTELPLLKVTINAKDEDPFVFG